MTGTDGSSRLKQGTSLRARSARFLDLGFGGKDALLAAAGVVLFALSMPPRGYFVAGFFVLAPLLIALKHKSEGVALRIGFLWGLAAFAITLWWFYPLFGPFAFPFWAVLGLFVALFSVAFSFVERVCGRRIAILAAPALWTAVDFLRSEQNPLRFGWLSLGYSQHNSPYLLSLAQFVGVYGVTAVLATTAALVVAAVEFRERRTRGLVLLVAACLCAATAAAHRALPSDGSTGRRVGFRAVQVEDNFDKCLSVASKDPVAPGSVIVLPEYSLLHSPSQEPAVMKEIVEFVRRLNAYLVVGCIEFTRRVGDMRHYDNVALLFSPSGEVIGRYQKHHPIQFFRDGSPGRGYPVLGSPVGALGVGICYDLDYEDVSRNLAAKGAQVLVAPTEDLSTWGETQHIQHAAMMPFRAVETGRWMVRPAASGISCVVAPDGTVRKELGFGAVGYLDAEVPLLDSRTVYVRFGYLVPYALQALAAGLLAACAVTYLRRRVANHHGTSGGETRKERDAVDRAGGGVSDG